LRSGEISFNSNSLIELIKAASAKGASLRFTAKGFSMSPFIKNNDIVTISPLANLELSSGRVVAFINPQTKKLVIHRIVGKYNGSYLLKGDAVPEADGLIPRENILGIVNRVERNHWRLIPFSLRQVLLKIRICVNR